MSYERINKAIQEKTLQNDKKILHELIEKNAIAVVVIGDFKITGRELLKLWEEKSEIHKGNFTL